jgi:signal transduction histidine kinase
LDIAAFMIAWLSGDLPQPPLFVCFYVAFGAVILAWRHLLPLQVYALMLLHQLACPFFAAGVMPTNYEISLGATYAAMAAAYTPWVCLIVALAAVASDKDPRWSVPAAFLGFLAWAANLIIRGIWDVPNIFLVLAAVFVTAWIVGRFTGRSLARIQALQASQAEAARAVATERAIMAAELHDIVSHAVTVMTLHAAGARRIVGKHPERAAAALGVIEEAGTQAMDELRRMMDALRSGDIFHQPTSAPLAGINEAGNLLKPLLGAGFHVKLKTEGAPRALAASVSHTAYRVIQESLTNVAKHAGTGARVEVLIRWTPASLTLDITDDGGHGRRPEPQGPGFGLLGLSERVAIVGGTLLFAQEDSGFHVRAHLPVESGDRPQLSTAELRRRLPPSDFT